MGEKMKLLDLVNEIKRKKSISSVENAISEFESEYSKQYEKQNINLNDEYGEGVFFVGGNRDAVDQNSKIIGRNALSISETTYSRAIYNQKRIEINGNIVDIISYECPLLRTKRSTAGNQFKLDLLGFCKKTNSIAVIECKYKVGNSTNPQYGLIESFFYALAISKHLSYAEDSIFKQIEKCYFENRNETVKITRPINIGFYVVAPRSYWKRYINNKNSRNSISKTENLLVSFIEERNLSFRFSGYLSLGCCGDDIIFKTNNQVHFPYLYSETQNKLSDKFENMK